MALVLADRVQETTTTTGTGSIALSGAVAGYQTFAVVGNGNTCYYTIVNNNAWEVGIGTYSTTGPTLARTTVLSNSSGNTSPITLSGTSTVFLTYPAEKSVNLNAADVMEIGQPISYSDTGIIATFASTVAGYNQVVFQNKSTATNASANINVSNDASTSSTGFAELGINSSTFTGSGSFSIAGAAYLASASTDLTIGTYGAYNLHFVTNSSTTDSMTIFNDGGISLGGYPNPGIGNISANKFVPGYSEITSAGGTTVFTAASNYYQRLVGTSNQTFQLPDATTLVEGTTFVFDNDSTGTLTIKDGATTTIDSIPSTGVDYIYLIDNSTVAGTWIAYSFNPSNYDFTSGSASFGGATISNAVWNGTAIAGGYGGTGLTSFGGANNALYSTGSTTLTAGTLPVAAGGTGITSLTAGYIPYGNGTSGFGSSASLQFNGTYLVVGGTTPLSGATNPIAAFSSTANNYVQTYTYNASSGTSASSDFVAYANNSTDAHGWADMGFTSSTYADSVYTVTGPNEAYLFGSALNSSYTGNLVYATDSTGSANAHQWYVGGFTQLKSAWKMQLTSTGLQLANALAVAYGGTGASTATANYFFAAPNGSSGAPAFRAIVAADIPTLNQNTTGTAGGLSSTLAVTSGGTGLTSVTANNILYGNGTSALGSSGNFTYNGTALGLTSTNATGTIIVTDTGTSGANIKLVGNGATTPNKTIRAFNGNFEVINNAYGAAIFTLSDAGVISTSTWQGATIATTYTAAKVTDVQAGTGVSVSATTGSVSVSIGQAVATSSNVQFNSLGVGTAGSGTAGEIRATNNITAYYSDNRLKTKIGDIENPLEQVRQIKTLIYHANEVAVALGYDASVIEVGLDAQSVQAVQPHVVAPAPIDAQYLTVRYERLVPLLVEAIKALDAKVDDLAKLLEK